VSKEKEFWPCGTEKSTNNAFTQTIGGLSWSRLSLNAKTSLRSSQGVTKLQKAGRNISTIKGLTTKPHGGAYSKAKK
jgi:hypothetical protein